MNKEEVREIADACEKASGPDRELDALICAAFRVGTEYSWAYTNYPAWIGGSDGRVSLEKNGPSFEAPAYTASLDAAMTLVPGGWRESYGRREDGTCIAWCHPPRMSNRIGKHGDAATPALAMSAAALRASAHLQSQVQP